MPDRAHIGLDNTAFRGRLRQPPRRAQSFRADVSPRRPIARPAHKPVTISQPGPVVQAPKLSVIAPQPFARPALPKQQRTEVLHRQAVRRPRTDSQTARPRRSRMQLALVSMAVFIFLVGVFVSLATLQTNKSAKSQVAALAQKAASGDDASAASAPPSETKPDPGSVSAYQVSPDAPKFLQIPKLGVNARIKPMGVKSNNELQAPNNIYDTGWYSASARPGDAGSNGAMLIDGHVHGPTLPGVFVDIKKLQSGDTIQVVRGDNKTFTYVVVKVQNYDAANLNMAIALSSIQPGEAALNLMTCGGPYDKVSGEYTQRTIVFAVLKI